MNTSGRSRRAAPMAPDDRRVAILAAVTPVILAQGAQVTTKELAQAAGVAEGTLFRAFTDKDELIRAAVLEATDPLVLSRALMNIDLSGDLPSRISTALQVAAAHSEELGLWIAVAHQRRRAGSIHSHPEMSSRERNGRQARREALQRLLEPDRDRLAVDLAAAAEFFDLLLTGVLTRRIVSMQSGIEDVWRPDELAAIVVAGLVRNQDQEGSPC